MNHLRTENQLIRLNDVLERLQISRSAWYAGIREGRYPKPIKLGKCSAWRASTIETLVNQAEEVASHA